MKRKWKNFWLNLLMFVQILILTVTGIIMKWVLPPGSGQGQGSGRGLGRSLNDGQGQELLLGLGRHDWGDIHFWVALSLVAVLALHLYLHWSWATSRFRALFGRAETSHEGPE